MKVEVARFPMAAPGDVSGLRRLIEEGKLRAEEIVGVMAKTEGNGCVNDFTRAYATFSFQVLLAEFLGIRPPEVAGRVAFVMSGGTEGVLSPHATVFALSEAGTGKPPAGDRNAAPPKRLAIGVAHTRDFPAEELGRMAQVETVAEAVRRAMTRAGIGAPGDVHFVQVKCPLLTSERIREAAERGKEVVTHDTYESMGYSRGASALGVGLALGEIAASDLSEASICSDWSLYSAVASASAGVELLNCEIIVMGNSPSFSSDYVIGHSVMQDAVDARAVREALGSAGLACPQGELGPGERERLVNVFAKAEADFTGFVRGRRHTMMNDSDINNTRHARSVVGAVVSSVVGDTMVYVSGGAEHQGPLGGGPVAAVKRVV